MDKRSKSSTKDIISDDNNNVKSSEELVPLNWTIKDIYWKNVIILLIIHIHLPYALYLLFFRCQGYTILFTWLFGLAGGLGSTSGNHRYWCHKSFKAKLPMQIIMMLLSTTLFHLDIMSWVRLHRNHHKFTDTDGDPHNSKRGFFYSHFGWMTLKEPIDVTEKSKQIDNSDIFNDPVLQFQKKYFCILSLILFVFVPTLIPTLWEESVWISFNLCVIFKFCATLNGISCVNSLAHLHGSRPYDKRISARQNLTTNIVCFGEGIHNYHHTFPYDYRASEFGAMQEYNLTKIFIDFFARIGWAYDLQTASSESIIKRKAKTGSIS